MIIYILILLIPLILILLNKKKEKYDPYRYHYTQENPNALMSGKEISGTVYSEEPDNVPGLGWVL